ncbi:hypothetical protein HPP92_014130 [Vanilla planifolia]|uniref:Small auxin up regulated protein n=1 Tax=Vanilla planifolia TaxID=51239 RepID=A0A835USU7_VANPL|nr:hypothetical protein HPP92_014548 [Vanilla planifolia]KAG0474444.1 hypothetical protein HPP92_014130 [Vanilla planifolia]
MVSPKKLVEMARRRMSSSDGGAKPVADKGHFIVYTIEGRRFMVPLEFLSSNIFKELFRISEDKFGLPTEGPIQLACDAAFMEYIMPLLRRRVSVELERYAVLSVPLCLVVLEAFLASESFVQS